MSSTLLLGSIALAILARSGGRQEALSERAAITIVEQATGVPLPCRVHLKDPVGKPVPPPDRPFWNNPFVCPGSLELGLLAGIYSYGVERGPEYAPENGTLTVLPGRAVSVRIELERRATPAAEGSRHQILSRANAER